MKNDVGFMIIDELLKINRLSFNQYGFIEVSLIRKNRGGRVEIWFIEIAR